MNALVRRSPLDHALRLADHGLPVFPVGHSKIPTCPRGLNAATCDAVEVRTLWRDHPGPLIGVRTGSASGLDCLDLDTTRHPEAAAWHAEHVARLPITRTHQTRSGGLHILFRHLPSLRCSTSKVARGVDVKAEAGCFTWWPANGFPVPVRGPVAGWPAWLAELLTEPPMPAFSPAERATLPADAGRRARYIDAAVRQSIQAVATAGEGQRNATLNRETFGLSRFIATGDLSADDVATVMATGAREAGLPIRETVGTIASALRARGVE